MRTAIIIKILLFINVISITICFGQVKQSKDTSEFKNLLCHKWLLTTMTSQGKSSNIPLANALYVTYNYDGSYIDSTYGFANSKGTWQYDRVNQFLITYELGRNEKAKIIKITMDELVVEMEYPKIKMTGLFKRVE